jgi:predicted permease
MTIIHDVQDTWRALARSPYFTIPVVLSLAFAIGVNVAAFSIVNALVLRPLPVRDPQQLFHITYAGDAGSSEGGNYPWFEMVRDRARLPAAVFIHDGASRMKVMIGDRVEVVTGDLVSGSYFQTLGVSAQLGRLITAEDERGSTPNRVAVLSDQYWAARFGRDPAVIGRTIRVDDVLHEIVGVARPGFSGPELGRRFDVAVPIDPAAYQRGWVTMALVVRLPDGTSPAAAATELTGLFEEFVAAVPARSRLRGQHVELTPVANGLGGIRERYLRPAQIVSAILGTVLLLACANWATLLLARASARRRELTIRVALGSSRFRISRQLVIESVSLALAGGALGFGAALWGVEYLPGHGLPAGLQIAADARVLGFTLAVTLGTGILFAIAPVWLIGGIRADDLRASRGLSEARGSGVARGLVVVQVALSLVLVVAAAFFSMTLRNLRGQEMGFAAKDVVTFTLDADGTGLEGERLAAVHRQILDRLRAIPDVQSATLASVSPLSSNEDGKGISIPGFVPRSDADLMAQVDTIGPGYFETYGIPILKGRPIADSDGASAPHVALISEGAARYYFEGADPIGRRIEIRGSTTLRPEIVGVVPDVMYDGLRAGAERMFYVPFYQRYAEGEYTFAVRTRGNTAPLLRRLPSEIAAVAPQLPVIDLTTLEAQVDARSGNERLLATMSGFFGALALVVAAIGIYGIVAYTVARRTPEIGVRIALGAPRGHVLWQVVRASIAVSGIGVSVGLGVALAASRLLEGFLFGLAATDPRVYSGAIVCLLGAAVVAAVPPVLRALRIDPVTALRYE